MEGNARETLNGRRGTDDVGRRSKDEIQQHIEATQEELRHTIEAIGESFSAGEILDTAMHALRVGPGEFAATFGRSVRDNPIAVSLIGAGLAWLMLGTDTRQKVRHRAGETGHQLRDKAGKMRDKAEGAAGKVRGKAEGAAGEGQSVADSTKEKAEEARGAARRGYEQVRRTASEQPLMIAAVGLVAGAAAAAMIPRSRTEEQMFGERAEEAVEKAEDAARGVGEGVRGGFEAHSEPSGGQSSTAPGSTSDPSASGGTQR